MNRKSPASARRGGGRALFNFAFGLAAAGGSLALASPALAQETAEEEIVVTGSHIRGTPETASLPVEVITAQDLQNQGSPSVTELVRNLGVSTGIDGNTNQFTSNGLEGLGNINLRGLGPSRTLVLFNGHRMVAAPYGIGESAQSFVDTNLIPANAIGRIEVLKDGAAATYGSDAIAGVVNFITRRGFEGFEIGGDYRFIDGSDGDYGVNTAFGWANESGTVDFFVAGGMQHRSVLGTLARDWAILPFASNPLGGWSAIANPGRFLYNAGTGAFLNDPACASGTLSASIVAGGVCRFQYTQFDNLIEEEDRFQIYGEFNVALTPDLDFHAEALYAYTDIPDWETSPSYPPQVLTAQFVPGNHPGLVSLINQTGGAASPFLPLTTGLGGVGSLFLGRSFGAGGFPGSDDGSQTGWRTYEASRLSAGLAGQFDNDVHWDVTATYMEDTGERLTNDTYITRLNDALSGRGGPNCVDSNPLVRGIQNATPGLNGCLYYNPFSTAIPGTPYFDPTVVNTPELANWLTAPTFTSARTTLFVLDAVLDGELGWTLPGGAVGWAAGVQYREDGYSLEVNDDTNLAVTPCPDPLDTPGVGPCTNATGPFAFLAGTFEADLTRNTSAVFGEMRFPIFDSFEAILAARYEVYGGDAGSTFDPKLSLRWQVAPWLAFRGSAQTSFRGPTLTQLQGRFTTLQFVAPTNAFKAIDTFGNPDLQPESAFSFNIGTIIEAGGFQATIDYWSFSFDDPVAVEPFDAILAMVLANCASVDPAQVALRSRVVFSGACAGANVARVQTNIINGPAVETSGVDVSAQYTFDDVVGGELTFGAGATYLIEYVVDPLSVEGVQITPTTDLAGYINRGTGYRSMPQTKVELFTNFEVDGHNFRWVSHYVSDYADRRTSPVAGVDDSIAEQWTHDFHYNWQTPWNARFSFSVFNVFDEDPPFAFLDLNYDPYTHDPVGRQFRVGFTQQFN